MSELVYGVHAVTQMLEVDPKQVRRVLLTPRAAPRCEQIQTLAAAARVPVTHIGKQTLEKMAGEGVHQGVAAEIDAFKYVDLESIVGRSQGRTPLVVVCDSIQDPHNLGAILRSACVLGADGVVIPKDRACEVTPTVMKTAAGAAARIPVARVTNLRRSLDTLKSAGFWVVGTDGEARQDLQSVDLNVPLVLVVGSEATGLRHGTKQACDVLAKIPMQSALGSLNASVAAAIALYETARQRSAGPAALASNMA